MLILSRNIGEALVYDDQIDLEIKSDQVRLGVRAPMDATVHREEGWGRIGDERAAAV